MFYSINVFTRFSRKVNSHSSSQIRRQNGLTLREGHRGWGAVCGSPSLIPHRTRGRECLSQTTHTHSACLFPTSPFSCPACNRLPLPARSGFSMSPATKSHSLPPPTRVPSLHLIPTLTHPRSNLDVRNSTREHPHPKKWGLLLYKGFCVK